MDNVLRWEQFRAVPKEAQKSIGGGRLKGMTDINPMWRLMALTEAYGECGIGWKYEITKKELVDGANGEVAAFVDILLYVKENDKWSDPIPGMGGSMYIAKESSGLRTNDEGFKMALTDALSVSCKALGLGADIYWQGGTKYTAYDQAEEMTEQFEKIKVEDVTKLLTLAKRKGINETAVKATAKKDYKVDDLRKLSNKALTELTQRISVLKDKEVVKEVSYEGTPFEE